MRVAVVVAVALVLAGGLWVFSGLIAPGYWTSIIAGVVWFVLASVLLGQVTKRRPELKWPVRGTFLVTAVAASIVFVLTSVVDKTVDEKVETGVTPSEAAAVAPEGNAGAPEPDAPKKAVNVQVAAADFEPAEEGSAAGRATVVEKASGGRVLTFTGGFEVHNGPDLRVYLVPGDGRDTGDNVDLGGLKGNRGDQQYTLPSSVDTGKYKTVVVWCRAFSVAFARATLEPVK
jgi:hypothetical protein